MPSLTPLSPSQIADLFGALDDFIGTGNGVNAIFQTTYFPVVDTREVSDEMTGVGDGATTVYQLFFFPITPGTLELHKTAVNGPLLVDPTHYTVNLATGIATLTLAGVAFLGTEQLHAKYTVPSTLELHKVTITGPLLTPVTHYKLSELTGKITLTATGITFLGTAQLHAKYQIRTGLVNVLTEANGSLRASVIVQGIQRGIINTKDISLRYIHETIETQAVLFVESERRALQTPTAIIIATLGNYIQPAEKVTDTAFDIPITDSVTRPYAAPPPAFKPLYPFGSSPNSPDPAKPFKADGLFGGSGNDTGNEQNQISVELASQAAVIAAGADVVGFPGPIPPRSGWYLRYDQALLFMIPAILAENVALAAQVSAITAFLVANPTPVDLVTAGNIADATAASAAATAQIAANSAYLASIPYPSAGPYPGLSNAALAAQAAAQATRQAFITTRIAQITAHLTTLYNARFFWISSRTRLSDGTKRKYITTGLSIVSANAQIADNTARINEILTLLAAQ